MINKILHLRELSPAFKNPEITSLSERTIIIDPTDVENPPCLNLFDFGLSRLQQYDPLQRETLINGAIALYEYMFTALLGAELTNRQGVIFRYLARLLMIVPNATIYTLMDFVEEPDRVRPYLPKLDVATQRFLTTQLFSSTFDTTRQQILTRLWGILSNSALARMFSHTENKLDFFEAMNSGSLILINTAKDLLKQEGCELFGRFMIALITQATQERAAIAENKRLPTYIYIDEAHDYFEEEGGIEMLLNTARKYKVGVTIAAQNLSQFSRSLSATVMTSTSTKVVGGLSADDAAKLAKEMNVDVELLQSLKKGNGASEFAMSIRNVTSQPTAMMVPLGELGKPSSHE